jgi:hypothetical protein
MRAITARNADGSIAESIQRSDTQCSGDEGFQ